MSSVSIELIAIISAAILAIVSAIAEYKRGRDHHLKMRLGVIAAAIVCILGVIILQTKRTEQLEDTRAANEEKRIIQKKLDETYESLSVLKTKIDKSHESLTGLIDQAEVISLDINRAVYPLKDVRWSYIVKMNLLASEVEELRKKLNKIANKALEGREGFGSSLSSGSVMSASLGDQVRLRGSGSGKLHLALDVESSVIAEAKIIGAILGYSVAVDFFSNPQVIDSLDTLDTRGNVLAVNLLPPWAYDIYQINKYRGFDSDDGLKFQLKYYPGDINDKDDDELYVEYYWLEPESMDKITLPSDASATGIPDLIGSHLYIRLSTNRQYWGKQPPYFLESLRIRIGEVEGVIHSEEFNLVDNNGEYLIYHFQFPASLQGILKKLKTVRRPEREAPARLFVPRGN